MTAIRKGTHSSRRTAGRCEVHDQDQKTQATPFVEQSALQWWVLAVDLEEGDGDRPSSDVSWRGIHGALPFTLNLEGERGYRYQQKELRSKCEAHRRESTPCVLKVGLLDCHVPGNTKRFVRNMQGAQKLRESARNLNPRNPSERRPVASISASPLKMHARTTERMDLALGSVPFWVW